MTATKRVRCSLCRKAPPDPGLWIVGGREYCSSVCADLARLGRRRGAHGPRRSVSAARYMAEIIETTEHYEPHCHVCCCCSDCEGCDCMECESRARGFA